MAFLPCLEHIAGSDLSISYLLYTGLDRLRLLRLTLQARAAQGLRHCSAFIVTHPPLYVLLSGLMQRLVLGAKL